MDKETNYVEFEDCHSYPVGGSRSGQAHKVTTPDVTGKQGQANLKKAEKKDSEKHCNDFVAGEGGRVSGEANFIFTMSRVINLIMCDCLSQL